MTSNPTRDFGLFALVAAVAALLLSLDPPGYFGGRWDDGRYLEAALAWVERGPVTGTDHWALRWPVVLPAAAAIEWFGRTRDALMLPGLAVFAALLTLNFWAARRVLGPAAAAVAMLALLTTSEILLAATRLTADLPELLFLSAGAWAFAFAARSTGASRTRWLLACGAAAGLAFAVRETAASLLVALVLTWLTGAWVPRRAYVWIAAGFAAIWLPEQLTLYAATGDPLYRLHTDLRHIEIPSTNLRGLVAPGAAPALNLDVMARWKGVGPIHLHYLVDPWLNLFLNGRYGLDFLIAAIALLAARTRLHRRDWRAVAVLAGLAVLHIAFVVYVIATDPKPRMFMPAILCACLVVGIAAPLAWQRRARLWLALLAAAKLALLLVTIDITAVYKTQYDALAHTLLDRAPGPVHADHWTLSSLALADARVRDRLRPGPPPVGAYLLTVVSAEDAHGDGTPAGNWRQVDTAAGPRKPRLARFTLPLLPSANPLARLDAKTTPVARLWQRLPDRTTSAQ